MKRYKDGLPNTLLIVDDEPDVRELLQTILEEYGHTCLAVEDAATARRLLREIPIELVLTDRDMPEESGLDLIRTMQEHHPDIGAIMVTVIDDISQAREALGLGVYGYITKPFTRNQVVITVENALRHRRLEIQSRHYAVFLEQEVHQRTEALQDQLNLLQTFLNTIPSPVFYKGTDGIYKGCNQAYAELVGVPRDAIVNHTVAEIFEPQFATLLVEEDRNILKTGVSIQRERTFRCRDGVLRHSITYKAPYTDNRGVVAGLVGAVHDITRLKDIEQSLRLSEGTLRTLIDTLHIGVIMLSTHMEVLQTNRQMQCWFPDIQEGIINADLYDLVVRQRTLRKESRTRSIHDPAIFFEEIITLATTKGDRLFKVVLSSNLETDIQAANIIGLLDDVTEAISAERELRQAQKLEAIGQLAAGIAHEINTPIQYIGDNVHFLNEALADITGILKKDELLLQALRDNQPTNTLAQELESERSMIDVSYLVDEIPQTITETMSGVKRVADIVRAMREFSHPGSEEKALIDLNRALENTITVSRNEWKYVAEMEINLDDRLPMFYGLPGELNQVFLNIIVNAAQAIAEAADNGRCDKGLIMVTTTTADQSIVEIRISDTGNGIPVAIQERIFDPFFTTKEVGKGTGQGLTLAHNVIVERHRGSLHFTTKPGHGTTFIIRLPIITPDTACAAMEEPTG